VALAELSPRLLRGRVTVFCRKVPSGYTQLDMYTQVPVKENFAGETITGRILGISGELGGDSVR
jgi:hypothetical protein